jgi:hypothetical protein
MRKTVIMAVSKDSNAPTGIETGSRAPNSFRTQLPYCRYPSFGDPSTMEQVHSTGWLFYVRIELRIW